MTTPATPHEEYVCERCGLIGDHLRSTDSRGRCRSCLKINATEVMYRALDSIADGLEADGRTVDGMTKRRAAEIARQALAVADTGQES